MTKLARLPVARITAAVAGRPRPDVFSDVERITSVGVLIGALEMLAQPRDMDDRGVLAWPIHRGAAQQDPRLPTRLLDRILSYPAVLALPAVRAAGAVRLLTGRPGHAERAALLSMMTATSILLHRRHNAGRDGSDHMQVISLAVAAVANAFSDEERIREWCLRFIAFQSCASYATSGAVKVVSPTWLSGRASTGVFRTETYGDEGLLRLLKSHPLAPRLMAWGVIAGELSFPLVTVAPRPLARAMLAAGVLFHIANGRFMGLNRFVWAFTGTYPAVAHVSRALGQPR